MGETRHWLGARQYRSAKQKREKGKALWTVKSKEAKFCNEEAASWRPGIEVADKHCWDLGDRGGEAGSTHHPFEIHPAEVTSFWVILRRWAGPGFAVHPRWQQPCPVHQQGALNKAAAGIWSLSRSPFPSSDASDPTRARGMVGLFPLVFSFFYLDE